MRASSASRRAGVYPHAAYRRRMRRASVQPTSGASAPVVMSVTVFVSAALRFTGFSHLNAPTMK